MKQNRCWKFFCVLAAALVYATPATGATVTIAWDPNPEPEVSNYTVFAGLSPGTYTTALAVGLRTTWTFTGLQDNRQYYFGVQAQSATGVSPVAEISVVTSVPSPGSEPTRNDFNGDRLFDLLWHHRTTGQIVAWHLNGLALQQYRMTAPDRVPDTNWRIRGTADFNSDGKPDFVWHNASTGDLVCWFMDGVLMYQWTSFGINRVADTNWQIGAVSDFNGDGKPDLIWQNQATGELVLWLLNGTTPTWTSWMTPRQVATNWKIRASGDFDRDGRGDLVWHNQTTGELIVWHMDGPQLKGWQRLNPDRVTDPNWRIASVGDTNGDGWPDLVWQHEQTGALVAWRMNGSRMVGWGYLTPSPIADTNWKIVAPR